MSSGDDGSNANYTIELDSIAHVFKPDHRMRVQVSSSDFPQWDRNLNTGGQLRHEKLVDAVVATQFVLHDDDFPSHITLPIVEGMELNHV